MAVTKSDAAKSQATGDPAASGASGAGAGSLAASVGLTDADLVEMYRYVALARALDERMWILNRAGRIPFVISGQGHEGAQVGIAWAFQRGHDDEHGRGEQQPGRRPRRTQLRGDPQAAVHLRRREQRLRHQRSDGASG